jgi:hypothetical protein
MRRSPDIEIWADCTSPVSAFTYDNFTFGDPSKSDAIDARRISCE